MASILFYEIDPNYSYNNKQFSPGTNEALNQDYTTKVTVSDKMKTTRENTEK
jgi:hypothetical protein